MTSYVRFPDLDSPEDSRTQRFQAHSYGPVDSPTQLGPSCSTFRGMFGFQRAEPRPASNYLALIPLSDDRLKPRRTKLIVAIAALFTIATACLVFFLVPRGVDFGEVKFQKQEMSWNRTEGTYQLVLNADIPVYNANYWQVEIEGDLSVVFFDQVAGNVSVRRQVIARRANPQNVTAVLDASNVPAKYHWVVAQHCHLFPRQVIFFLQGEIKAHCMGKTWTLPRMDTYFIIKCEHVDRAPHLEHVDHVEGGLQLPGMLPATGSPSPAQQPVGSSRVES